MECGFHRASRTTSRTVFSAATVYLAIENVVAQFSVGHQQAFHATNDVAMHRWRVIFVYSMHLRVSGAMCWPNFDYRHSTMTSSMISLRCCSFEILDDARCPAHQWKRLSAVPHIDDRSFDSNRIYPADSSCYRTGIADNDLGRCSGFYRASRGIDSGMKSNRTSAKAHLN